VPQTGTNGISIEAIPAFSDNYIWLIRSGGTGCAVVDPGDASPVLEKLARERLDLKYILLTHHHADHIGGAKQLLDEFRGAKAFGPDDSRITFHQNVCREGDTIQLHDLDLEFKVLEVPAHTKSHIAFHGHGLLFSGDTLFSVGCGRLFEGTAEQMQASLDKMAALPPDTRVYCGHEYTVSNCLFALRVEPDNQALRNKARTAERLRADGKITLPGTLREELKTNPFMRTREDSVVAAARTLDATAQPGASVVGIIRRWKDAV
jgi:hydroxyacylglutathione hydrolase